MIIVIALFFFKIGPTPASFLFIFGLFKQTIQFLQQINVKKCPSSIRRWDSNPRPLERESTPITTRPGLPPLLLRCLMMRCSHDTLDCIMEKRNRGTASVCRKTSVTRLGDLLNFGQHFKAFGNN